MSDTFGIVMWLLTKDVSFSEVADKVGVSTPSIINWFDAGLAALEPWAGTLIVLPSPEEWVVNATREAEHGFEREGLIFRHHLPSKECLFNHGLLVPTGTISGLTTSVSFAEGLSETSLT